MVAKNERSRTYSFEGVFTRGIEPEWQRIHARRAVWTEEASGEHSVRLKGVILLNNAVTAGAFEKVFPLDYTTKRLTALEFYRIECEHSSLDTSKSYGDVLERTPQSSLDTKIGDVMERIGRMERLEEKLGGIERLEEKIDRLTDVFSGREFIPLSQPGQTPRPHRRARET